MFTIIIEDKDGAIAGEHTFEAGEFIIGRSHSNDIVLPADNVSRRHARLYTQDEKCFIEDMNSSNGVLVDGNRINRVYEIVKSAQIKIGDFHIHIESSGTKQQAAPEAAPNAVYSDIKESPVPVGANRGGSIFGRLIGVSAEMEGRPFDLVNEVMLVGRGKDCSITIIDASVSRIHAKILVNRDGELCVEDVGSSNGTYINDERIKKSSFSHGDHVRFGNIDFICEMPGYGDAPVVEVASGARKGLIFLIAFMVLLLVGGVTSLYVFNDQIFGPSQMELDQIQAEKDKQEKKANEKTRQFKLAKQNIEDFLDNARTMAGQGDWDAAKKKLLAGNGELKKVSDLDTGGELRALFETGESKLRKSQVEFVKFTELLDKKEYENAATAYGKIKEAKGTLLGMATKAFEAKKMEIVAAGDALCTAKKFEQCLALYTQALKLDSTDKEVAKKKAHTRLNMNKGKGKGKGRR
ncbi:MAG TPA: FHA domain-containing protein [Myxococcales bacterium]|nr:FHA domain-containing protein [Myxococcales bacterium]